MCKVNPLEIIFRRIPKVSLLVFFFFSPSYGLAMTCLEVVTLKIEIQELMKDPRYDLPEGWRIDERRTSTRFPGGEHYFEVKGYLAIDGVNDAVEITRYFYPYSRSVITTITLRQSKIPDEDPLKLDGILDIAMKMSADRAVYGVDGETISKEHQHLLRIESFPGDHSFIDVNSLHNYIKSWHFDLRDVTVSPAFSENGLQGGSVTQYFRILPVPSDW